jgi:hypothetical protein
LRSIRPSILTLGYLSARKHDNGFTSADNLYASFYLWDQPEGLDAFLTGPGFVAVSRDFGWPKMMRTWVIWQRRREGAGRVAVRRFEVVGNKVEYVSFGRPDAVEDHVVRLNEHSAIGQAKGGRRTGGTSRSLRLEEERPLDRDK